MEEQMRRLKLQMHISINGMVAAHNGKSFFNWNDEVRQYSIANAANVDCILLGRKTATGFIPHWKSVAENPQHADFEIGKAISEKHKVVFSKTLSESAWPNATIAKAEIAEHVNQLKRQPGKDLLVYGGSGFVTSLIARGLVEYHLLVNPIAIGSGATIFARLTN